MKSVRERPPVISFASTKGGVGKTTLAFVLATAIANRISGQSDYRVACVDADPNTTLDLALRKAAFPEIISMTSDAEALLPSLREAQSLADLVLIDLEGSANQAMLYAAGKSDLVIIPAQPSAFDVREARRTAGVVQQAADALRAAGIHAFGPSAAASFAPMRPSRYRSRTGSGARSAMARSRATWAGACWRPMDKGASRGA